MLRTEGDMKKSIVSFEILEVVETLYGLMFIFSIYIVYCIAMLF
jgi:hypothetical protein